MKKTTKIITIIMILTIAVYSVSNLNSKAYAANETTNTNSTSSSNSTANTTSNTSETASTTKSSNANLSDLGINPNDFSGFKYGTTTYDVTVPETVTVVEVYAKAQDSKATLTGTGSKSLSKGKNALEVVVTAEDGTKKTYTINVTREGEVAGSTTGASEDPAATGDGLSELTIENTKLNPDFSTGVYEYTAKYIGEETKLKINTKATDTYYTVEVTGNEDLKEGENLITILVSDPDGKNVATYQVTVNKSLVDEEAIAREEQEKADKQQKLIIICAAVAFGVVVIIGGAILIHVRRKRREEDYYYDDDDYDNDYEEDDYNDDNYEEQNEDEEDLENIVVQKSTDSKEDIKKKFLDNYNKDDYEDEFEDIKPKRKAKGKRFK